MIYKPTYVGTKRIGKLGPLSRVQPEIDPARVVNYGLADEVVDSQKVADLPLNRRGITL